MTNPASGRGRGARELPAVRAAFQSVGITDVRTTARAGDEARLVQAALGDGADTIAVVGGDGTWGKCAAAVAAARAGDSVRLALVSAGTGNDFAKNFDAPTDDVGAMARLIVEGGAERRVDIGAVESAGHVDRFLNIAGFGFDAVVLEDTSRGGKLSGNAVYIIAALRRLLTYPGLRVRISALGPEARTALLLVFANGMNYGGAFRIAPRARVDDGQLDLIAIGDVRGLARVPLFMKAMRGAHLAHPKVTSALASEYTLRFDSPPACNIDGDLVRLGSPECVVRCEPAALRVVTGRG